MLRIMRQRLNRKYKVNPPLGGLEKSYRKIAKQLAITKDMQKIITSRLLKLNISEIKDRPAQMIR